MQMTYYGRDKNENIKSVKDPDGSISEYSYNTTTANGSKSIQVAVVLKGASGNVVSQNQYEYVIGNRVDGEEWTKAMVAIENGVRTETVYAEATGAPLSIKRGSEETKFDYDQKGRVMRKVTPTETTVLSYDTKAGKVSKVEKSLKKGAKSWSEFKYDDRGNLSFARDSGGKAVNLFYDLQGRIKSMVDQKKSIVEFVYNEHNKPIEITRKSGGKTIALSLTYKPSGEVDQIKSKGGRTVSSNDSDVSDTLASFQNLMEIIKPSGVNLSF